MPPWLVKATAKKRLPCSYECYSRQAEDYLNRLCGPRRKRARERAREREREREREKATASKEEEEKKRSATRRYLYVVPSKRASGRDQKHPSSCSWTKRTPLILLARPLEFAGRAAAGINSLIGLEEKRRGRERERDAG